MATDVLDRAHPHEAMEAPSALAWLTPLGRVLFALIFVASGFSHFAQPTIAFAASQGVPFAGFFVPLAGILAIVGGLGVAFGYHTRIAALLLVLFLVPVTFKMHAFWTVSDAMLAMNQRIHFMKNISMLGAALFLLGMGGGPLSVDALRHHRVRTATP